MKESNNGLYWTLQDLAKEIEDNGIDLSYFSALLKGVEGSNSDRGHIPLLKFKTGVSPEQQFDIYMDFLNGGELDPECAEIVEYKKGDHGLI